VPTVSEGVEVMLRLNWLGALAKFAVTLQFPLMTAVAEEDEVLDMLTEPLVVQLSKA
jgi:hypothetical protein